MNYIINNKCSVSRFGDGEVKLMLKENIPFQESDLEISKRLVEIHQSNLENHIVCLPNVFNGLKEYNMRARKYWVIFLAEELKDWNKYILKDKEYYNAFITRPYLGLKDKSSSSLYFSKLRKIWLDREIVIIEGDKSRLGVGNNLFDNVRKKERILCPSKNAFAKYESILKSAKKLDKSKLILVALGPTATILAYDLHKLGYQTIDIGHIDIEYEWYLKKVKKKVKVENKYTNESANGDQVTDVNDLSYFNEIIEQIY